MRQVRSSAACVLASLALIFLLAACQRDAVERIALDNLGRIPPFELSTHLGGTFSRADLAGKPTVVNFIFTRCPTVCPVFTMKMKRVGQQLPEGVRLLSFSVDPAYDTPARLKSYADDHGVEGDRWLFLTGDASVVRATVEGGLKISMDKVGEDEKGVPDIVHNTHFVLLDATGTIRGYYNSDDDDRIKELVRAAKFLAKSESS